MSTAPPLHVYVHFPWCLEKCPYCDFVSFKTEREAIDHEGYADAIVAELQARASADGAFAGHRLSTIFLGGGTPSLWAPAAVRRVIDAIRARFPADPAQGEVEVTAECNPSSLDPSRARGLVDAGVTRLSIGVQSLDGERLRFLGRLHDAPMALSAVRGAVSTGARVSADLIFGLPGQSPEEAAEHAGALADLGLDHLSCYALTIEPGTRFGELARRGRLPIAEEDSTCDAFLAIEAALGARGLAHYEVSNYARPGQEARHNLGYWRGADYLGLGCAAYGFVALPAVSTAPGEPRHGVRWRNEPDPARYVAAAARALPGTPRVGDGVTSTVEPLDAETLLRERIMLGLRLADGFDLVRAAEELGLDPAAAWTSSRRRAIEKLTAEGALAVDGSRLRIPPNRRLSTDGVAARLF
ncbi:MAG: radical SAM family heme chaperone HemW [Polyangiales bacterium]